MARPDMPRLCTRVALGESPVGVATIILWGCMAVRRRVAAQAPLPSQTGPINKNCMTDWEINGAGTGRQDPGLSPDPIPARSASGTPLRHHQR
jgi:hypothetical protein